MTKTAERRAYEAEWRAKNKGRKTETQRRWLEANKDRLRERRRERYRANREKAIAEAAAYRKAHPDKAASWNRKQKYGVRQEQYDALLAVQGGVCAICRRPPEKLRLAVDHDHGCCSGQRSCGKCVRGLLCGPCNTAIGSLRDDPALLAAASKYLTHHQARRAVWPNAV